MIVAVEDHDGGGGCLIVYGIPKDIQHYYHGAPPHIIKHSSLLSWFFAVHYRYPPPQAGTHQL